MAAHIVTRAPPPRAYTDLQLCRIYHCTPSELDEQDAETIDAHIICLNEEYSVRKKP